MRTRTNGSVRTGIFPWSYESLTRIPFTPSAYSVGKGDAENISRIVEEC